MLGRPVSLSGAQTDGVEAEQGVPFGAEQGQVAMEDWLIGESVNVATPAAPTPRLQLAPDVARERAMAEGIAKLVRHLAEEHGQSLEDALDSYVASGAVQDSREWRRIERRVRKLLGLD